jgi:hypothetical protein
LKVVFRPNRFTKMFRHRALSFGLWMLFLVSVVLMLKSSSDPLPLFMDAVRLFSPFLYGKEIIFNLSVGIIVSLFIYVLVVWIPEQSKRKRVRRNLALQYGSFKEECLSIFFSALQESYDPELLHRLKDQTFFREYFKEKVSPDQERWHAVLNGLDDNLVKRLVVELEILIAEVHYALTVIDVDDPDVFSFLKRLTRILYRYRNWSSEYDDVKQLSGFMWSVHTGWSVIDGYTNKDIIAEMIEAI